MKKKKMVAVNIWGEILRCIRWLVGIVLIMASPFAWILRDGLGPNAHTTTGFKAVARSLSFCNIWILVVALVALSIAIRFLNHLNDTGHQKGIVEKKTGLAMLVVLAMAISLAICAILLYFDSSSNTFGNDVINPVNHVNPVKN